MLVDSHCHLNYPALAKQRDEIVARARQAGVVRLLTANTTMKSFSEVREAAASYDDVFCSAGVHPHHCAEEGESVTAADLVKLTNDEKIVAIGETGLDYFYDYAPREEQHRNFREHIRAAIASGLPLIVHSRDAEEDTIRLLQEEGKGRGGKLKGVMHCFSSKRELAEEALKLGFYISFSGILTFGKSEGLRTIARDIPLDRLLVETDAPYLAPEPYRGKLCEPAFVAHTARKLAEVKNVSYDEIAAQTTANFFRLFDKVYPLSREAGEGGARPVGPGG
ncbi:MAG: TatD family hydrolase [Alphaproteobacteria bacterium]|nr:TatD family hydrolase [Alphaproteobacteria bacterium]